MIIDPSRRRFLGAALAFVAAPMIVRASSLMPVRALKPTLLLPEEWTPAEELNLAMTIAFRVQPVDGSIVDWEILKGPITGPITARLE